MTNTTQINNLYPVANATSSSNPFVDVFLNRDPTVNDIYYPTQKKWLNTNNNNYWMLEGFVSSNGNVTANWIRIGGGAVVEVFTVDAATAPGTNPVVPTAGNITVTGGQVAAGTTSNVIRTDSLAASTYTIEIQRSQAVASSTVGDNGVCHFDSAQFAVDANGFVTLAGGGGAPVLGIVPDAHTAPGTSPVVPNGSGNILVTGGQVAAGTTTNVIRTDSLAANTYTIEVQRSQAVGSSTVGDNGVCHFNSADFSVDTNAFVSLAGSIATSYVEDSGTAIPSAGVLNVRGGTGISTTGSGNTVTITASGTTGGVIQMVSTKTSSIVNGTTPIPYTTTPQNTDGTQLMTLTITPKSSSSTLYIEATVLGWGNAGNNTALIALYQDSTASALCTQGNFGSDTGIGNTGMRLVYTMTSGTTSATTFKIRGGPIPPGTSFVMNTFDGTNNAGGTLFSVLSIWEVQA